jgi:hypothetical protein
MPLGIIGVVIGLLVSAGAKLMSGFLFASTPHDRLVLAGGCGLLLAFAMPATRIPAIRRHRHRHRTQRSVTNDHLGCAKLWSTT